MYVDLYLSRQSVMLSEFKLVGITALQMAMKIEEVELVALTRLTVPNDGEIVMRTEQKMLKVFNFRLLPDTLNYWL